MTQQMAKMILQPGVEFAIPGNSRSASVQGRVQSVARVNFTYTCTFFGHLLTVRHSLADVEGLQAANIWPREQA